MPYVAVAGINAFFIAAGMDGRPPPLLYVHAIGASSRHGLGLMRKLRHLHPTICVDLPGHGRSSGVMLPTIKCAAKWLDQFLSVIGIRGRCILVGHSLGGLIGLRLTLMRPGRVAKAVVIATAAQVVLHPFFIEQLTTGQWDWQWLAMSLNTDAAIGARHIVFGDLMRTRARPDALAAYQAHTIQSELQSISVPVTVVIPEHDDVISPRKQRLLAEALPHATRCTLPGARHYVPLEAPERVAAEIVRSLKPVSLRPAALVE